MRNYNEDTPLPSPPFNLSKTYEVFDKESIAVDDWYGVDAMTMRLKSLELPEELFPLTTIALNQGQMLLCWSVEKDKLGYALHKKLPI